MIWLENIKAFFVNNSSTIAAVLTPANIAAVVTAIVMAIKNSKATKQNSAVGTNLDVSLKELQNFKTDVDANNKSVKTLVDKLYQSDLYIKSIDDKLLNTKAELLDRYDEIEDKITAMLDVQSMVYGTIQNEDLRLNVQNTIANAKITADKTRSKLQAEIDGLREEVATKVNAVAEAVADGIKQIESASATVTETKKKKSLRY